MRNEKEIRKMIQRFRKLAEIELIKEDWYGYASDCSDLTLLEWVMGKDNEWQQRISVWKVDLKRLNLKQR